MNLDRSTKTAIVTGALGATVGCTLLALSIRHEFETGAVTLMLFGSFVMVLSPTIALLWALGKKGRIQNSDIACSTAMLAGMLGMSQSDHFAGYWFADTFALLFWAGFHSLIALMVYRVIRSTRQSKATSGV